MTTDNLQQSSFVSEETQARAKPWVLRFPTIRVNAAALFMILAYSTYLRFTLGAREPLFIDETWTGVVGVQHSFSNAMRSALYDVNAPLYYIISWVWAQVFGISDVALRLPSALFGTAAPLAALFATRLAERRVRWTWCALLALWAPGIDYSQDARCYTLLLFLAVLNTITFADVLSRPNLKSASIWCAVSMLMIVTHYLAGFLVLCEGVTYLALRRKAAMVTWPAALIFLPALASFAIQYNALATFARTDVAWFWLLDIRSLLGFAAFLVGSNLVLWFLPLWLVAVGLAWVLKLNPKPENARGPTIAWIVSGVVCASAIGFIAIGFFRPIVISRYLFPFEPGFLLLLSLIGERVFSNRLRIAVPLLLSVFLLQVFLWTRFYTNTRSPYNFEVASQYLEMGHPRKLVFLLDHPETRFADRGELAKVGGFFLQRDGNHASVEPVVVNYGQDANRVLLDHAQSPGTALLWLYDREVQRTAARCVGPDVSAIDPRWHCYNFGRYNIGVVACRQSGPSQPLSWMIRPPPPISRRPYKFESRTMGPPCPHT